MDCIVSNDGSPSDETALGDVDVFDSIASAEEYFEYWISEEPGVRFYDVRGERLIAIDHGDHRSFHLERTGTFFKEFGDLIAREAARRGTMVPAGSSTEDIVRAICVEKHELEQERGGCFAWFLPPRSFREKYGFWSWYLPFLRKEPTDI